MAIYDGLVEREAKAWGDPKRGNPRRVDEWERVWREMEQALPRAIAATAAVEEHRRRIARLDHPMEFEVRVRVTRERMSE